MSDYTEHFSKAEMACRCGCGDYEMNQEFLEKLEDLRNLFGKMTINSAKRCEQWNSKVGGENNSFHLYGNAIDVCIWSAADRFMLVKLAIQIGFRGIGIAGNFVHLDIRQGNEVIFLYPK